MRQILHPLTESYIYGKDGYLPSAIWVSTGSFLWVRQNPKVSVPLDELHVAVKQAAIAPRRNVSKPSLGLLEPSLKLPGPSRHFPRTTYPLETPCF
jgi:hypothetical protein